MLCDNSDSPGYAEHHEVELFTYFVRGSGMPVNK